MDSLFCLEFVEIASLAKYEPVAWDKNEPNRKGAGAGESFAVTLALRASRSINVC